MKCSFRGKIAGVLLAGGQARRMGGVNKCLLSLSGKPLLTHVLERAKPQVGPIVLNANGDPADYMEFALPVAPDVVSGSPGPLAGILTGLEWVAKNAPNCTLVASFPGDSPFFPRDLVEKLYQEIQAGSTMACASSGKRHHPVFGLWPIAKRHELREALLINKIRKVDRWTSQHKLGIVDYPVNTTDPFFNLNTPEDLAEAEKYFRVDANGLSNENH